MNKLALFFALFTAVLTLDARAQAETGGAAASQLSPPRVLQVGPQAPHWNAEREGWYRRNRAIAITGKVATVVGVAVVITAAFMDNLGGLVSGYLLEYGGLFMWSGADLKATNRFRGWGFQLRKAAAVVSLVGAFISSPITMVAGSMQSARIRDVHGQAVRGPQLPSASVLGAGLRLRF